MLDDEIKPYFTWQTKLCSAIKYSDGGQLMATSA